MTTGRDSYLYAIATDRAIADDGKAAAGTLTIVAHVTFAGVADEALVLVALIL